MVTQYERHKFYSKIAGGYVKPVKPGIYDWVVSFDLNSLYPNIIVQNNVSPETITPERLHRDAVPVNPEAKAEDQIVQLGNYYLDSNNKFQTENAVAANVPATAVPNAAIPIPYIPANS